jgi:hypothetical protein
MFSDFNNVIGCMVDNDFNQANIFFDGITNGLRITFRKRVAGKTFFKIICYEECDGLIFHMKKMISLWASYLNYNKFNRIDNVDNSYNKAISLTCSKEKSGCYNFQLKM